MRIKAAVFNGVTLKIIQFIKHCILLFISLTIWSTIVTEAIQTIVDNDNLSIIAPLIEGGNKTSKRNNNNASSSIILSVVQQHAIPIKFQPPTLCNLIPIHQTNATLLAEARNCLERNHGTFYDACNRTCYTEMSFLPLTQGLELEHIVYGHLFPILVLLVVVANVFVVLVLSQKHMVTSTTVVLKYMAIADLCVGLVPLPWNFFYHTLRNYEHQERLELWWCYMYKYSMDAVPPVCHNIAMWLTVLLAGQRYISIQYPLLSRQLCSVRNVRFATIAITALSILCGLPKSLDYYFEVYEGWAYEEPGKWIHVRSCLYGLTNFVKMVGSNTFFNCYFWTRVFGFIMVPSILLIILNALLIRGIHQAKKRKDRLLREKRAREAQRQKDSNSTSIMLVVIVTIFLLVNLPQALFMAMLCVYSTFGISNRFLDGVFPVAFLLFSNMLVMATYPINFGIYCFMSSSFRDTFWMFFCRKHWANRLTHRRDVNSDGYNRYTVRRSDPSLQFNETSTNCGTRYSILDTMVYNIDNGTKALSTNPTAMPFLPLISSSSPPAPLSPVHHNMSSENEPNNIGPIAFEKTYQINNNTDSTETDHLMQNIDIKETEDIIYREENKTNPYLKLNTNETRAVKNGIKSNIISNANYVNENISEVHETNIALATEIKENNKNNEMQPLFDITLIENCIYMNKLFTPEDMQKNAGKTIADIADTDEKILAADAVFL